MYIANTRNPQENKINRNTLDLNRNRVRHFLDLQLKQQNEKMLAPPLAHEKPIKQALQKQNSNINRCNLIFQNQCGLVV
jgi:hypothetical protein